jgi:hypothetical protein
LNSVRVTDLSSDGDAPNLSGGTTIGTGTYTVSHYIDTIHSTSTNFILYIFTFHALSGGFTVSNANATFTLSSKTFGSIVYSGPAWSNASVSAIDCGNGIYRVSITATTSLAGTGIRAYLSPSPIDTSYLIVAGSQYERGSTANPYYATTGTTKTRGTTWYNLISGGVNGTSVNGPTYSSANGGSLVFDGVDDYVTSNSGLTNNSDFSVSFWIKYQDSLVSNRGLITSWDPSWNGFGIAASSSSTIRSWTNNGASGGMNWGALSTIQNTWAHLTLTYTFFDKTQRGYINGVFKNSESFGSTITHSTLQIGRGGQTSSAQLGLYPYTNCLISNVQIYNRALAAAEVLQNFNATRSRYGI